MQATSKRADQRFSNASDMIAALRNAGAVSQTPLVPRDWADGDLEAFNSGSVASPLTPVSQHNPISVNKPISANLPAPSREKHPAHALAIGVESGESADPATMAIGIEDVERGANASVQPVVNAQPQRTVRPLETDMTESGAPAPGTSTSRMPMLVAATIVVVVLIAAILLLVLSGNDEPTVAQTTPPVASKTPIAPVTDDSLKTEPPEKTETPEKKDVVADIEKTAPPTEDPKKPAEIEKVEPEKPRSISIAVSNADADVFENGKKIGSTPMALEVQTERTITLRSEGFKARQLRLKPNSPPQAIALDKKPASTSSTTDRKSRPKDKSKTSNPSTSSDWIDIKTKTKPKTKPKTEVPVF